MLPLIAKGIHSSRYLPCPASSTIMRSMNLATAVLVFAASVTALRPRIGVDQVDGPVAQDSYIVQLRPTASKSAHISKLPAYILKISGATDLFQVTHEFDFKDGSFIGYAGNIGPQALAALRTSPDVLHIEQNAVFTAQSVVTQADAPATLAKISGGTTSYVYDSTGGAGVDIYIIDTGIYTAHSDFGGRARWGATFGGYANADGNGHGTFCASLAGGTKYGVAKKAGLVAVKVLSDAGSGTTADVISGINWATNDATTTKKPAVLNLSLGGGASTAVDNAVTAAINAGVYVVVAAGAENTSTLGSPARVPGAITVGTSTGNTRASFSNYGPLVDIFAPGVSVQGAWIGAPDATNNLSGTSWSTCYTSGLVAYIIGLIGNVGNQAVLEKLHAWGLDGTLTGIPSGTNNEIIYNNAGLP